MIRGYLKWIAGALGVAALTVPSAAAATQPATVVPGCEKGCDVAFSRQLPGGKRLEGLSSGTYSALALWRGKTLLDHIQVRGRDGYAYEFVEGATCASDRCSVGYVYGAHSGAVASVAVSDRLTVTDTVEGASTGTVTRDLNGDGQPDAAVQQSTYMPNFAQAPQYWETYVQRNGKFTRTGCTGNNAPAPVRLATGPCTGPVA